MVEEIDGARVVSEELALAIEKQLAEWHPCLSGRRVARYRLECEHKLPEDSLTITVILRREKR